MLKTQSEAKQGKVPAERAELGGHSTSVVESSAWGAGGSPRQGVRAHWGKGDISRKEWLNKKCVRSWQGEGMLSGGRPEAGCWSLGEGSLGRAEDSALGENSKGSSLTRGAGAQGRSGEG